MRIQRPIFRNERTLLAGFFGAFVIIGFSGIRNIQYSPRVTAAGSWSSTDSDLFTSVGLAQGSERLTACFETLRTDGPVIVFYREEVSGDGMAAQITSSLGWPRRVWLTPLPKEGADAVLADALARDPAALFFIGVPPRRDLGVVIDLGGSISFVRREKPFP